MATLSSYFKKFRAGDTTIPDGKTLLPLSKLLDDTTQGVVLKLLEVLRLSPEHETRIGLLQEQPTLAGKYSAKKILLKDASCFEQMVAVADWLEGANIRTNHTFFLSAREEDYIPLQVTKFKSDATMMHVRLGATSGSHKAPEYTTWATSDPWRNKTEGIFIYPLESLEIVRQPLFSAATVIKGNAFEAEYIESDWRYGSTFACVEDGGQSKKGQPKITRKKEQSAGLNLAALTHALADESDPLGEERAFSLPVNYVDYSDNGYLDDLDVSVSPGALLKAAEKGIVKKDPTDLVRLIENLVIAKLPIPRTPLLCDYISQKLIANNAK